MFLECTGILTVDNINIPKSVEVVGMFSTCGGLKTVKGINCTSAETAHGMFSNCRNLEEVQTFGENIETWASSFLNCISLVDVFFNERINPP